MAAVAGADRRSGGAADPLGLDHLRAVLAHLGDVADEAPDLLGRGVDVQRDRSAHPVTVDPGSDRLVQLVASLASASIASASAFICLASTFSACFIADSILASMSETADHDQPGLALVELLADLLEVLAAHAGRGVAGDRAEQRAATGRRGQEAATDGGRREQGDDEAGGEADAAAQHPADPGRRLVLLDDLDLAVVLAAR